MYIGKRGLVSRGFVQEVWFEGVPAAEVWYEGVKLYPDERTVVRDLVLGGVSDAYWVHAVDAVSSSVQGVRMRLTVGERQFHLGLGDGSLPVLRWVNGAWRAEAEHGLLLNEVLRAEVLVEAEVPERSVVLAAPPMTGGEDVTLKVLPVIEGTVTRWRQYGNKRRAGGHYWQSFTSPTTGEVFFKQEVYKEGRTARTYGFSIPAGPVSDTESIMRVWFYMTRYTGGATGHTIVYPAFSRLWTVRVQGCTLQRKEI